jgi:hypothetical protein
MRTKAPESCITGALQRAPASAGPTCSSGERTGPEGQARGDRSDPVVDAVDHHGLAVLEAALVEQRLARREASLRIAATSMEATVVGFGAQLRASIA